MGAKAFVARLRTTYETIFQIGKGGPQIKDSAGIIDLRNSADTDWVRVRSKFSVATVADLPAVAAQPDGMLVYVLSQRSYYVAQVAQARWSRVIVPGAWYGVTDLYVSPTGDAEANGTTALTPITADEAQARGFGCNAQGRMDTAVTLHVLYGGGATYGDVVWLIPPSDGNGGLFIQGEQTLVDASAFTAVTARVRATNTPLQVTDAAATWAVDDFIRLSGAHAGAVMPIGKITGNVATTGSALDVSFTVGGGGISFATFAEVVPGATETYAILRLPVFNSLTIVVSSGGRANFVPYPFNFGCVVQDVTVTTYFDFTTYSERLTSINRVRATIGHRYTMNGSGALFVLNVETPNTSDIRCATNTGVTNIDFLGGVCRGQLYTFTTGWVYIESGMLFIGAGTFLRAAGPSLIQIADAGFFDGSLAVNVRDGGIVEITAAAAVWGTSAVANSVTYTLNAFGSVRNASGTTWVLASPHKGALGTAGTTDATVGGQNGANTFDRATGLWSAGAVNLTMANIDAAVPGGFGAHAWSPEYGAGLVTG